MEYSIDVTYAYAQLGLPAGAPFEDIQAVRTAALAYKFVTKARLATVRHLVDFFATRAVFGPPELSFADIKKAYHRKAMTLHPDRNSGNKATEEQLKKINAAYGLIDEIHKQAKIYYKQSDKIRHATEHRAYETTQREKPAAAKPAAAKPALTPQPKTASPGATVYMAASIPRSIRTARLGYLPLQTIIGSKAAQREGDINYISDIIMLPEKQFLRAKSYLALPETALPALQYGKFSPPYMPRDTKKFIVPPDEADPETLARTYFKELFGL